MEVKYPIEIILKDKTKLICRPFSGIDLDNLKKFYSKIPNYDLSIFKDDVVEKESPASWFINQNYKKISHLIILRGKRIVANATLHSEGLFWLKTAEIKIVVDPNYRKKGIGSQLFNILLQEGLKNGIRKLIIRYTADNKGVIKILKNYHFIPEVILNYYVEDKRYKLHRDLIIASLNIEDWERKFEFYPPFFKNRK